MDILLEKTDRFVLDLFEKKLPESCIYHNYAHTKRVFKSTKQIIEHSAVSEEDQMALLLTALLHDTGYTESFEDHESQSIIIARKFLKDQNTPENLIKKVTDLIEATRMEHIPATDLEKIIRDADSSHMAKSYYQNMSELLCTELKLTKINDYNTTEWLKININFFTNIHKYYTTYALENWQPGKENNLKEMVNKLSEIKKAKKEKKAEKLRTAKEENPEKGIQTAFRVTLRNHMKLSDIADTKANILLSVNAIIISLALSNLIPKLDNPSNTYLIIPTLIFVIFSIISMVLSVLATRPNVTSGEFTQKEVDEKKVNLLFFGNFHKMPLENYKDAMHALMLDKDYIYDTMIKDLYFLGKVLHKKYKILRITYTVFIIGIIVSVIAFIIAFKTNTIIQR